MKGLYTGFYKYDNERIRIKLSRDQTFFDLEISDVDGQNFSGIVKEEASGQPDAGLVTGEFDGENISFIKRMNIAASILPDGQLKTYKRKHPKIYYKGVFEDGKYAGTWKIRFGFIFEGFLPIPIPPIRGTWEMRMK